MKRFRPILKGSLWLFGGLFLFSVLFCTTTAKEYGGIYDKTVRLHVLADSDDERAQELKLLVRDDLLLFLEEELADCQSKEEAAKRIEQLLPALEECVGKTLSRNGCDLPVSVTLSREPYPRRVYEDCTYPAGTYTSLRVHIGSGRGRNWWCVVYPPLCLSASSAAGSYTEREQSFLEGKEEGYELKSAVLELGARLIGRLWR